MKIYSNRRLNGLANRAHTASLLAAAVLLFPAFLPLASAQSTWTGTTSGAWGTSTNWNPGSLPLDSAALTFGTASNYSVDLGGATRKAAGASALTFTSSNDYTFTNGTLTLASSAGMAMNGSGDAIFNIPVNFGSSGKTISGSGAGALIFNGAVTRSGGSFTISTHMVFAGSATNSLNSNPITLDSGGLLEVAKTTQAAQETALGTGDILMNGGALRVSNAPAVFTNTLSVGSSGGTIEANQNVSFGSLTNNGVRTMTFTGTATVTFNGNFTQTDTGAGTRSQTIDGSGNSVFNGTFSNNSGTSLTSIVKSGSGTSRFNSTASTYTGPTSINGGVLEVVSLANGGVASSIGQATNAAANLAFDGGTLRYVGTGGSTNRGFTLGNNGGTIDASGSGALAMTGTALAFSGGAGPTLTLTGSNTGNNSLATVINNNGGNATNLVKSGNGSWALTNASTYTGSTTISAGTLLISGTGAINTTSGVTLNGANAAFRYNSSTNYTAALTWTQGRLEGTNWGGTLAGLTIGSGRTISPGNSPGTANTTSQTWAGGGSYVWEINDATGTPGSDPGWDLVQGSNTLAITATSGNKFTIYVTSLTLGNTSGNADNFDNTLNQSWLIADFANPVSGFSADAFAIDLAGFTNPTLGGSSFSVVLGTDPAITGGDNSQIYLTYAIPEPTTGMFLLLGAGVLALRRRRVASSAR